MKYTETIDINKSLGDVIALFEDPASVAAWQKGFTGMSVVEGAPGKAGSKTELNYDFGKRQMTLTETIEENALPERFIATYETSGVFNLSSNHFKEVSPGVTRWVSDNEFRFHGFMMKTMGLVMPGAFRKQTRQMMADFKAFVEDGTRVDQA